MNDVFTNLGAGAVLAWIALPLLAGLARRGDEWEPASQYRAATLALLFACACVALPFMRAATSGEELDAPVWVEQVVRASLGDVALGMSPLAFVGALWTGAVVVSAARAIGCARSLARMCADAHAAPPAVTTRAAEIARALGIAAPPVLVSDDARVPFTFGLSRPVIVLPRATVEAFDERAVALILRHELTHVARGDLLSSAAIVVARLPFPMHPTARSLARDAALARERAVDAAVAALAPNAYAKVLIDVAGHTRFGDAPRVEVGMGESDLTRRVLAILDPRPRRRVRTSPLVLAAFVVATTMFLAPRVCTSSARPKSHCAALPDCCPMKADPC